MQAGGGTKEGSGRQAGGGSWERRLSDSWSSGRNTELSCGEGVAAPTPDQFSHQEKVELAQLQACKEESFLHGSYQFCSTPVLGDDGADVYRLWSFPLFLTLQEPRMPSGLPLSLESPSCPLTDSQDTPRHTTPIDSYHTPESAPSVDLSCQLLK